jgi:hypothetical protein
LHSFWCQSWGASRASLLSLEAVTFNTHEPERGFRAIQRTGACVSVTFNACAMVAFAFIFRCKNTLASYCLKLISLSFEWRENHVQVHVCVSTHSDAVLG